MGNTRVMPNKLECNVFRGSLFLLCFLKTLLFPSTTRVTSPFNLNKSLSCVYARANHDHFETNQLGYILNIDISVDMTFIPIQWNRTTLISI